MVARRQYIYRSSSLYDRKTTVYLSITGLCMIARWRYIYPELVFIQGLEFGGSGVRKVMNLSDWPFARISCFHGANFLRQQLLQCCSRETLAIGSAFKCERGWMDGACCHGDEHVVRVLITLLRRRIRCWEQRTMRTWRYGSTPSQNSAMVAFNVNAYFTPIPPTPPVALFLRSLLG